MSMQDLTGIKHSTPLRHARSEYTLTPHHEDEVDVSEDEAVDEHNIDDSKPLSPVRPMMKGQSTDSNDLDFMYGNEEKSRDNNKASTSGITNIQNVTIHQRNNSTRSYNSQYTPVKNFYRYENPDGKPVAATMPRTTTDVDNIGIVRPNNSRIGLEATVDTYIADKADGKKKKKKKGIMKIFKLCGGGKSSKVQRNNSVYQKTNIRARPIPENMPFPEERLLETNHRL